MLLSWSELGVELVFTLSPSDDGSHVEVRAVVGRVKKALFSTIVSTLDG